ncbi:helix-turn-helix domain-containing protein [Candidatus Uhrbacteria bacterium]|nr:helix-turn-helix domain-containing protein [Candidatus Uhrbacteria bacterium]
MPFILKLIEPAASLGSSLRKFRESLGWTIEKAARETRIQGSYLQNMEEERWEKLPEEPARSHLLKRYVRTLGDPPALITLSDEKLPEAKLILQPLAKARSFSLTLTPFHWKLAGFALIFLGIIGYLGWQVHTLLAPPFLVIDNPSEGFSTPVPTISIQGITDPQASVTINEQPILKTSDGTFRYEMHLEQGANLITIAAAKRYSRPRTIYRTVVFEGKPNPFSFSNQ